MESFKPHLAPSTMQRNGEAFHFCQGQSFQRLEALVCDPSLTFAMTSRMWASLRPFEMRRNEDLVEGPNS
jgi:hypothetical protein